MLWSSPIWNACCVRGVLVKVDGMAKDVYAWWNGKKKTSACTQSGAKNEGCKGIQVRVNEEERESEVRGRVQR
jgi:hypothetical protein